jgi:hypothetical protein
LLRVEVLRTTYWWLFGRLALAETSVDPGKGLRDAHAFAKRLHGTGHPAYGAWGHLLEAGIATIRGDAERALGLLASAGASFEERGLALYRAVAQRRQGELMGGDAGRALVERADAWMASGEYVDAERITAMYAPGFGRARGRLDDSGLRR